MGISGQTLSVGFGTDPDDPNSKLGSTSLRIARNRAAMGELAASAGPRYHHLPSFTQLN
jgi:hypothetical protein